MGTMSWPKIVRYRTLRAEKWEEYGFEAPVRIPDRSPVASSNVFFLEFGFTGETLYQRPSALVFPAPQVRSLLSAAVDYDTNLEDEQNMLTFQIRTVTAVPKNGGLLILSPNGFHFPQTCYPRMAERPHVADVTDVSESSP